MPKTWKNSFQKVCFSALSLLMPAHSRENLIALCRISFQLIGMSEKSALIDYRRQCRGKAAYTLSTNDNYGGVCGIITIVTDH